jgi:tetratricopeptide (TPR) repeat protein
MMNAPSFGSPENRVPQPEKKDNTFVVKSFDRIINISLFMLFFGFPLFFTGLTFQGIVFEKQIYFYIWLILGLVAWAAKGVTTGEMKIRRTPLDLPILGFWLAYMLATIFSVDRWHSFWGAFGDPSRGFMNITALIIAYYLIMSNFNVRRFRLMFSAVIISGVVVCLWTFLAIMNIKFLPDSIAQYAPISVSGSVLGIAMIISAMIPLLTVAILKLAENSTINKITKKVTLTVLLLSLALSLVLILSLYNFVPWLALFVGVVVFLVFILAQIVRPKASWTWLPMVLFVAVMAIRMIGVVPIAKINFAEVKPLDWNMSMTVAKNTLENKAILGSGPATFGYDFSLYRPQDFNNNMFYNLRFLQGTGVLFEALPTVGIIGTFFLIIVLLSFLGVGFYLLARNKEKNKLMTLGLFSAAVILLTGVASTKAEGTVLIMTALIGIIALAMAVHENDSEEKYLNLSLKASPKFALALAFIFMVVAAGVAFLFVFLGKIYVADFYAGRAGRIATVNRDESLLDMATAIKFYPQEGRYYGQLGQYYMILANTEALKGEQERDVEKIKQYLNSSIAATNIGRDMAKNDVGSVETLAQIYENGGYYVLDSYNLAVDNYKKALELEPHNPSYYIKIGQIKMALAGIEQDTTKKKQMVEEAKDMFTKATQEKADLPDGYYNLSLTQNALGDNDAAIESGKKAVTLAETNTNYILSLARVMETRGKEDDLKNAEQLYRAVVAQNGKDVNGHFYLGLLLDKQKKKTEAKDEYSKVIALLPDNNDETKKQLQKMIANVEAGIENTPANLGLTKDQGTVAGDQTTGQ